MSLSWFFKDMAISEDGVIKPMRYKYIFCPDDEAYEKAVFDLVKRRGDKDDAFSRRLLKIRQDEFGRDVVNQHRGVTVRCPDIERFKDAYPVVKGTAWVPERDCKKCPNRVRSRVDRRRWSCKLLRDARRGDSAKMIDKAVKDANDLINGKIPDRSK